MNHSSWVEIRSSGRATSRSQASRSGDTTIQNPA